MGVNLDMIRFEYKIVIAVTHQFPYCVAVAIWLLEGCITKMIDNFEEFKEKHTLQRCKICLGSVQALKCVQHLGRIVPGRVMASFWLIQVPLVCLNVPLLGLSMLPIS